MKIPWAPKNGVRSRNPKRKFGGRRAPQCGRSPPRHTAKTCSICTCGKGAVPVSTNHKGLKRCTSRILYTVDTGRQLPALGAPVMDHLLRRYGSESTGAPSPFSKGIIFCIQLPLVGEERQRGLACNGPMAQQC